MRFEHPVPPFNRVFLFAKGGASVSMEGIAHDLRSGVIYLLPVNRSFVVDYRAGSELFYFHVHALDGVGVDIFDGADFFSGPRRSIAPFCEEIVRCRRMSENVGGLEWRSLLAHVLCAMMRRLGIRPWERGGGRNELLAAVERMGFADCAVKELAERMTTTPRALAMRFKRQTGSALKSYLLDRTMTRARVLLATTMAPVREVAATLGYQDVCYFQRIFKKRMGITPLEYRLRARTRP